MEILKKSEERIILKMPANEVLANSIRRSVPEVPTLAIAEVEIFKNDSALYDEVLAHRLGLVALKTDKTMKPGKTIDFKLSKTGPCTVYSEDLQGPTDVVFGKTPLTILSEGHKIELIASATIGTGIEHSKYTPGLCYYRHLVEVKSSPKADEIMKNSKGLVKPEKSGSKWICDLNDSEIEELEKAEKDSVKPTDEIVLILESYGNMPAQELLQKTLSALTGNLDEFEKAIK